MSDAPKTGGSVKSDAYDAALSAYLSDRYTEAAAGFEAVLALDPENEDALEMAAAARRAIGDDARASALEAELERLRDRRLSPSEAAIREPQPLHAARRLAGDDRPPASLVARALFVVGAAILILLAGGALAVAHGNLAYVVGGLVVALVVGALGGADLRAAKAAGRSHALAWEMAGVTAALAALALVAFAFFADFEGAAFAIALVSAALILGGYVLLKTRA